MADGWIEGNWVEDDWAEGSGPPLPPGYWPHNYWPDGYWEPSYWGVEPTRPTLGGRAHKKAHVVPSIRKFVISEEEVLAQIRRALAKAALAEKNRRRVEQEDEEGERREYYRKLGMMGAAAKKQRAQEEEAKARARLANLEKARRAPRQQEPVTREAPWIATGTPSAETARRQMTASRATAPHLPPSVKDKMDGLRRDAALADAQAAAEAKRKREEEIRQTRLKNLAKARKAKRK